MKLLDGRVAIVTGASSGIGRGCALRFAEEGATVVGCARRLDKLEELVAEIESRGGAAMAVRCDVANGDEIRNVVTSTIERFGKVEILANIAQGAMGQTKPLAEATPQGALDAFITGPLQSMLFMQECFPHMKQQRYGRIINTGSQANSVGHPGHAAYNMAKGAIMSLTRNASQEWAEFGIVTNTFLPVIQTSATETGPSAEKIRSLKLDGHPMKRIGLPYEDCAPVLTFLASEGASYLNGQVIAIDGGRLLIA